MAHGRLAGIRTEGGEELSNEPYPEITTGELGELTRAYRTVTRIRLDDINDFANLPNRFMRGRLVGKVPSASTDTAVTDRPGDFSFAADATYMYFFVESTATPVWRRVALGAF